MTAQYIIPGVKKNAVSPAALSAGKLDEQGLTQKGFYSRACTARQDG